MACRMSELGPSSSALPVTEDTITSRAAAQDDKTGTRRQIFKQIHTAENFIFPHFILIHSVWRSMIENRPAGLLCYRFFCLSLISAIFGSVKAKSTALQTACPAISFENVPASPRDGPPGSPQPHHTLLSPIAVFCIQFKKIPSHRF
jgi:hypothetical protein